MDNITLIDNIISVTMPVISPNISNIIKIKYDKNILNHFFVFVKVIFIRIGITQ